MKIPDNIRPHIKTISKKSDVIFGIICTVLIMSLPIIVLLIVIWSARVCH